MKHSPSLRIPPRGFSLVELMVTITILVILASFAMPAYNNAKRAAYWSKTPAQMTKIVEAFHAYASDHNDYFPPAYFPDGAGTYAQAALADNLTGPSGWLNSTIFFQLYPDSADVEGGSGSGSSDTSLEQSEKGPHLKDTVFEVQASVLASSQDDNLYNHSFLLNRSLVTERAFNQNEYAPRKSTLFIDLSSIMLLTEGMGGENYNSITYTEADSEEMKQGFLRYDNKFVHAGYMDGRVARVKPKDFPQALDHGDNEDLQRASHLFWKGVTRQEFETLSRTGPGRVNY